MSACECAGATVPVPQSATLVIFNNSQIIQRAIWALRVNFGDTWEISQHTVYIVVDAFAVIPGIFVVDLDSRHDDWTKSRDTRMVWLRHEAIVIGKPFASETAWFDEKGNEAGRK